MVVAREKKIRFQDGTNLATATRLLTQYSGAGISAMELETSGGMRWMWQRGSRGTGHTRNRPEG